MNPIIELTGVRKRFGRTQALDGLDLQVTPGEVHGFIGPNGAGKSTTIRVLLGQIRRDAGDARIVGLDCWAKAPEIHDRLAYVPGDVALWPGLTGGQSIDLLGRLQGHLDRTRRDELIERFALDPTKRGRGYSKGNRQKVALIAALACRAEVYLFDEPTSGLDPLMEAVFQECVAELREAGATVLLSSHILSEVEGLCDRVSIIRGGRIVASGTLAELASDTRIHVESTTRLVPVLPRRVHPTEQRSTPDGEHLHFAISPDELPAVVAALAAAEPRTLAVTPPTLDDLFRAEYEVEA